MEGATYPPSIQLEHPHLNSVGYYPEAKQFNANSAPLFGQPAPLPQTQQEEGSNVVVIQSQPSWIATTNRPIGIHYLILSIVFTILCVLTGIWLPLFCTIPAIIFSAMAQDADARGDHEAARSHCRIALAFNISGIVGWITLVSMIISIAVAAYSGIRQNVCYETDDYEKTSSYYCYQ